MRSLPLVISLLAVLSPSHLPVVSGVSVTRDSDAALKDYYSRSHSLGDDYVFDPREWQSVNTTNLDYKYSKPKLSKRASSNKAATSQGGIVSHLINEVWNGLKGTGTALEVKITWFAIRSLTFLLLLNHSQVHWA